MKKTQLEENSMKTQWNFNEDIRSSSIILQSDENLTEVPNHLALLYNQTNFNLYT